VRALQTGLDGSLERYAKVLLKTLERREEK
jgi:hypothetical protein